jgi:hypothetical protein
MIRCSKVSLTAFLLAIGLIVSSQALPALAAEPGEPIAYIGHGAFFDSSGNQIVPTAEFIATAQAWYRARLLKDLDPKKREAFSATETKVREGLKTTPQDQLILNSRLLDALLAEAGDFKGSVEMRSKLNALKFALQWQLPEKPDFSIPQYDVPFKIDPQILERFKILGFFDEVQILSATTNSGQAYLNECANNLVPTPPPIGQMDPAGLTGWKSQGFIPNADQFIVGTQAEVMTFQSSSPEGMCIALPRSSQNDPNTIDLDGVICLGKNPSPITGKSTVCFWDNQMNKVGFSYQRGAIIPFVGTNPDGQHMSGGVDLEGGTGGICTDCHAGQNPYIIHPQQASGQTTLGKLNKSPLNLPTFGVTRYDPLVAASWPQNDLSLTDGYVPGACQGCHETGGPGGRLPHLSTSLPSYCRTILRKAIQPTTPHTMPQFNPGTASNDADVKVLIDIANPQDAMTFCGTAPTANPSDRGDPHLTTVNEINYDFQGAGEFTSLRNLDTSFELQTRQTPISTTFDPGPNPHTGLASCVSLNTAVALRTGKHRITYQPSLSGESNSRGMELRIDGAVTVLSPSGKSLGDGASISKAATGEGIEVTLADNSRVIVTSNWWASQGYWYLNVDVVNSPAREGTMGYIGGTDWLPRAPDGSSFGPNARGAAR